MTVEIIHVSTPDKIAAIERLAQEIWPQHFTPIIGASQVVYMLGKYQSAEAIFCQIKSGWEYYVVMVDNEMVGYAGLVPDVDAKSLMLSKIYVKKSARGKGVGKSILDFVERKCKLEEFSTLWLTVNRFNSGPISWYEDRGFVTIDAVKKDIGGGFIMDDYVMERKIKVENA
jgi:GNAT superfamily N-acetyltransferase